MVSELRVSQPINGQIRNIQSFKMSNTSFKGFETNFYESDDVDLREKAKVLKNEYRAFLEQNSNQDQTPFKKLVYRMISIGFIAGATGLLFKRFLLDGIAKKVIEKTGLGEKLSPKINSGLKKIENFILTKGQEAAEAIKIAKETPDMKVRWKDQIFDYLADRTRSLRKWANNKVNKRKLEYGLRAQKYADVEGLDKKALKELIEKENIAVENFPKATEEELKLALDNAELGTIINRAASGAAWTAGITVGAIEGAKTEEDKLQDKFNEKVQRVFMSDWLY